MTQNTLLSSHQRSTKYCLIEKAKRGKIKHLPEFNNESECDVGFCGSMQNNF